MKKVNWMTILAALAFTVAAFGVTGCSKTEPAGSGTQAKQYTCSMHPDVVQDKPGNCPKCGMALTEKK
jgi:Cu+-exporting ATPase